MTAPMTSPGSTGNDRFFSYRTGYFEGEKLKRGSNIEGENETRINKNILPLQVPRMQFYKAKMHTGNFNEYTMLQGCGTETYLALAKYNSNKFNPGFSILTNFKGGSFDGWMLSSVGFKSDNFTAEHINHYGSSDYELDFGQLKKWEADTIYCHPAMAMYKVAFLDKYRKIAADRMASRGVDKMIKDSLDRVYNNMSEKEKCAYHTARQKYTVGSILKTSGFSSGSDAFVLSFDCNTGSYTLMTRTYNSAKKTFFKTNDEVPYYALSKLTVNNKYIDNTYQVLSTKAEICSICGGHGATYRDVVHTRGGSWESTYNPYVRIYTPERVIASWKERMPCTFCNSEGWRTK
jgi:hypothetical protein